MRLRVGVIGATGRGDYGHSIDTAFNGIDEAIVVAVADEDERGAEQAAARTGARKTYRSYAEMLEKEKPDIVSICPRWCRERAEMVEAAAAAGVKGILCEKPFAASLEDADRIVEACERHGIKMVVAHRRTSGYELHAFNLVRQGVIGEIRTMRGMGKGDERAGAQDFAVLGPHIVDSMRFFARSEVLWAHGHVTQDGRPVTPADVREGDEGIGLIAGNGLTAFYVFANGMTATYESYPSDRPGSSRFGFEVYGTRGILSIRNSPRGELYLYPHDTVLPSDGIQWERIWLPEWETDEAGRQLSGRDWTHRSNSLIAEDLVRAILEDTEPRVASTVHDARAGLEMIHAVHASHISGGRVYFPLADRKNPYEAWASDPLVSRSGN